MNLKIKYNFKLNCSMRFEYQFHRTALCLAVEKGNIEIVKLLLSNKNIDVNLMNISIIFHFDEIQI